MGLETGTYISDLNPNNPVNATDGVGEGDDHLRLIKSLLLNTFPNITGAVNASQAELNHLVGATENIQDALDTLDSDKADATTTANALALKANDADVVKLAGAQEITGSKNFSTAQRFSTIELGHASDTTLSRVAAGRVAVEGAELARLSVSQAFTAAQQFTTIELGHASDTTLSRIAAGRVAIEGGEIAKLNATQPFTAEQTLAPATTRPLVIGKSNNSANNKYWRFDVSSGGGLSILPESDAGATADVGMSFLRIGTAVSSVEVRASNRIVLKTQADNAAPATTGAQVRHADSSLYDVGMNVMPGITLGLSETFGREHCGKRIAHNSASAATWNIPASTDTSVPAGATFLLMNFGTGVLNINPGSGVTLQFFDGTGAPATGARTLSQGGVATLTRAGGGSWQIWGNAGLS